MYAVADIKEIERQPDIFHNGDMSTFLSTKEASARVQMLTGGEPNLIRSLVSLDGKEHKDVRGIVFRTSPRARSGRWKKRSGDRANSSITCSALMANAISPATLPSSIRCG